MKFTEFVINFVIIFVITFLVSSVVSFLYNQLVHSETLWEWETSFRFSIILGIVIPLVNKLNRSRKTN
ncbi:MAG: hypothetical protein AB9882_13035 [Ignavibacteriaceae bacterium]